VPLLTHCGQLTEVGDVTPCILRLWIQENMELSLCEALAWTSAAAIVGILVVSSLTSTWC